VKTFGEDIVADDGSIDRRALGGKVFGDEDALRRLTDIVWPEIRRLAELEISNINHMILFGQAKLIFDDQPSPGLVFVVHDGEEGLQEWTREKLRSDHVSKWTVVETLDPFGDIQASVIQIEENRSRRR